MFFIANLGQLYYVEVVKIPLTFTSFRWLFVFSLEGYLEHPRKGKMLRVLCAALLVASCHADVYMHNPRGSNGQ